MSLRSLVLAFLFACLASCGENVSPVSSTEDFQQESIHRLGKSASSDKYMREFEKAYDEVMDILKDLKRYIQKDPGADRHASKVKGLAKNLDKALRRLGQAFKNVRNNSSAKAAMESLFRDRADVLSKLGRYNLSYMFMVNPCSLPWIGEYLCKYAPTSAKSY